LKLLCSKESAKAAISIRSRAEIDVGPSSFIGSAKSEQVRPASFENNAVTIGGAKLFDFLLPLTVPLIHRRNQIMDNPQSVASPEIMLALIDQALDEIELIEYEETSPRREFVRIGKRLEQVDRDLEHCAKLLEQDSGSSHSNSETL
jgi:hypothetical protein